MIKQRMSIFPYLALLAALGLAGACNQHPGDNSKVLATVDGKTITENEYDEYLKARQLQQPPVPDKDKERETVLEEMITRIMLAKNAEKNKLQDQPEIRFQLDRQRENILARAMLRKYLNENPVTDAEVEKRYQQEMANTHKTEYRARHILFKTEEDARAALKQLQHGGNFAKLAKAKSTDVRSGKDGGELGWFNQGQMIPDFFNAVMQLKKGEITKEPVKTEFGWHIIQLEDERPLRAPSFDEVKGNIRQMVQQERVDALVKDLRAKANVKINK